MTNHEARPKVESIDLLLAFSRKKDGEVNKKCIRTIIRDFDLDLAILEAKLKVIGGTWRIHKTVNSRDTEKARKWLLKKLIDNPEFAGCVDSLWRTALLQSENAYTKYWLLDIDPKDDFKIIDFLCCLPNPDLVINSIETPNGWHYITKPFDTREICKLSYITLIRDGYSFVKKVGGENV